MPITNKWFEIERFYKNGTIIKEADGLQKQVPYAESKTMEGKAKSILMKQEPVDVEASPLSLKSMTKH